MATKRKSARSSTSTRSALPPQARLLFTQLSVQYAEADEDQWEELRKHMHTRLGLLSGGSESRRQLLLEQFDKVRTETLAKRRTHQLRLALRAGRGELVRDRGDGLEEWRVDIEPRPVTLFVPTVSDDVGLTVARKGLLSGWCPSCRLGVDLIEDFAEIRHNPLCPARHALEA